MRISDVVDAFDVEDAGDAFKLLAVVNVQRNFNARVHAFAATFKRADVGAGIADDVGYSSEHAGTVFGENAQTDGKRRLRRVGPIDRNAPLDLVEQILDVGAKGAVHGDAAAARDVADDVVSRNRIAAFRAIDHKV